VLFAERVARLMITVGGIGTILAVTGIFVFLVHVVAPLFLGASTEEAGRVALAAESDAPPWRLGVDENRRLCWIVHRDGNLELLQLADGARLSMAPLFPEAAPTAAAFDVSRPDAVFGFADGSLATASIGFTTEFIILEPEELGDLGRGEVRQWEGGIVERTTEGQLRSTKLEVEVGRRLDTGVGSAVTLVDQAFAPGGLLFVARFADGLVRLYETRGRPNPMTGKVRYSLGAATDLPVPPAGPEQAPTALLMASLGHDVYLAYADGSLVYYDLLDRESPRLVSRADLTPEVGTELTSLSFLLGRTTLIAGDSRGGVAAWFPVRGTEEEGRENMSLERVHVLPAGDAPVTSLAPSTRSRLVLAGFANGELALYHVTTRQRIARLHRGEEPGQLVALGPKEDSIVAWTRQGLFAWEVDPRHPEASLASLFTPVWYENYGEPEHIWQSSGGSDDIEPKLGLIPLIVGTLKATLYSMLFGAPLALLAAIFTSEFLHTRLRFSIKAIIELMASLPSVVLGFLAALVIAPFVREILPAILAVFIVIPLAVLFGAYVWQLLPARLSLAWADWRRFLVIAAMLPVGAALAWLVGPLVESLLFAGDVEGWLDGQVGGAFGGWFYLLTPLSGVAVAMVMSRAVTPRLSARATERDWDRPQVARADLLKFLAGIGATLVVAAIAAGLLGGVGLDTRGGIFGTYVQRNALIVGFVMGFAIVPIIYTLAEDALSEVPAHLREASLGAGATRWQTAMRIVVPTAMSGLFSALMIGLGRAVGETMIVLMAAGNTPIMDMNIFNGFRTLSANIAVELPEAVRNSTHYRTLFLTALVLFAITFLLNTAAEAVRRHFRKRTRAL